MDNLIYYVIGAVLTLVIFAFYIRLILKIEKFTLYQESQIRLLSQIALKQNVPIDTVNKALAVSGMKNIKIEVPITQDEIDLENEAMSYKD